MIKKHIVILETNNSEYGIELLKSASNRNDLKATFLTSDHKKYYKYKGFLEVIKKIDLLTVDTSSFEEIVATINTLNNYDTKVNAVIALTDSFINMAARVAKHFNFRFITQKAVEITRKKEKMRELCDLNNIRNVKYTTALTTEEALENTKNFSFPIVVKSNSGTGSQNVTLVNSSEELRNNFSYLASTILNTGATPLIEEFITGPLVSVEVMIFKRETTILGITDRQLGKPPYFVEKSYTFPISLGDRLNNEIYRETNKIIDSLDIEYGVLHIEFIINNNEPYLIEVNPRLGGSNLGRMITETIQHDVYSEIINLHLGIPPKKYDHYCATSTYSIYPEKSGRIDSIEGLSLAENYPGVIDLKTHILPGEYLKSPYDFKGQVATVWAKGDTSDLARNYAEYARNQISVRFVKDAKQ